MFERKARKNHDCRCYPNGIQKGERYFIEVGIWQDKFITYKSHLYNCDFDEFNEAEGIEMEIEIEIEKPLELRTLEPILLSQEDKNKNHNDKTFKL